jgi:hypothetical protein
MAAEYRRKARELGTGPIQTISPSPSHMLKLDAA